MWNIIKKNIRRVTPKKLREFFAYEDGDEYATKVYSQEGEDILLKRIFEHSSPGFYVDVGAHHPLRFSNTKLLYDMGWRGINIEPNPDALPLFKAHRPFDINLCLGISSKEQVLSYNMYNHSALNTFDQNTVDDRKEKPVSQDQIKTQSLKSVLDNHLKEGQHINLMSVDAEGLDLEILKSNDWTVYRPDWIFAEIPLGNIKDALESDISQYLIYQGYEMVSKNWKTCFYKKTE